MAEQQAENRDRIRGLVREVLKNVVPENEPEQFSHRSETDAAEFKPKHIVVNSLQEKLGREFDRDESSKSLITEDDLRGLDEGARIRVAKNAKFTPLAADLIAERQLILIKKEPRRSSIKVKTVAVGSDHGGYQMKELLKPFLGDIGLQILDFGTNSEDAVDYPDFAHAVAKAVAGRQADIGIIIDGAGIGSAMTANKVPGVRAAACYNKALAKNSREHNGANVLTLGSGQTPLSEAKEIIEAFISADLTEERHKKCVGLIDNIDRQYRMR